MILQQYDAFGCMSGESELIPDNQDRERTISIHQKKLCDNTYATFTISSPSELQVSIDVPCHMSLSLYDDATYYSSCFDQSWIGNHPAYDAYYEWLTSNDSPYRSLFPHSKPERILPKNGKGGGFILDAKNVKHLQNKWPLYNFMIAMRMVSEEFDSIRSWYTMVDLGLHPADALYLSRMFILQEYQRGVYLKKYGNNDGSHWPLSDTEYGNPNGLTNHSFRRFREADLRLTACNSSKIWWDYNLDSGRSPRAVFNPELEVDAERAGLKLYTPIRVIDAFKEYLKGE